MKRKSFVLVVEDKHLNYVGQSTEFWRSTDRCRSGSENIRSIGTHWVEHENGLPNEQSIRIQRWPAKNLDSICGRQSVLTALIKIREYIVNQ
ncbi:14525_t:CDS:2 [Funneliformis geosporum]|uniref:14525_t:CDS:1 n=1 Tax=Funneliformis geosporum TaxID=1117311 RepID=A0A9W4SY19_9GLOM|nr:14525_t:CDS:2 [Funneliformis geosporum]